MSATLTQREAHQAIARFLGEAGWLKVGHSLRGGPPMWQDPRDGAPYRTDHAYSIECERKAERQYQASQQISPETKQAIRARRKDRLMAAHNWAESWVKSIQQAQGMTKAQTAAAEEHLENIRLAAEEGEL